MGNSKASATAQYAAESLALRTGLAAVVDESGADPVISLGTIGAGSQGCKIKVLDQRAGVDAGFDALPGFGGVQQPVYTGTVFQVAVENNDGPALFHLGLDAYAQVIGELVRRGGAVEVYTAAHGNAPAWTTFLTRFDPNLYYPLSGRV